MKRTLHCPVCNSEFTTDKNAKKYCSAKCRRKANAQSALINGQHEFTCHFAVKNTAPKNADYTPTADSAKSPNQRRYPHLHWHR